MNKKCVIIGAGDEPEKIDSDLIESSFVICADAGYDYAKKFGIVPDLIVGDFDSTESIPQGENTIVLPCEKDETDLLYAVMKGFENGCDRFYIFGALGGKRPDHTFGNIQVLSYIAKRKAIGFLLGNEVTVLGLRNGQIEFDESCRGYLTMLSLTDKSVGVNITNLKYEVNNRTFFSDYPVGLSNEFCGKKGKISVLDGTILITYYDSIKKVSVQLS